VQNASANVGCRLITDNGAVVNTLSETENPYAPHIPRQKRQGGRREGPDGGIFDKDYDDDYPNDNQNNGPGNNGPRPGVVEGDLDPEKTVKEIGELHYLE
jgi:hypothetical protein